MILKRVGSFFVTRTSARPPPAHRPVAVPPSAAGNFVAGKAAFARPRQFGRARPKNHAPQDCFGAIIPIISRAIDFRPDDISYPPVQPVQALTTLPKIRSHQPMRVG